MTERVATWIEWFGPGRLVASTAAVLVVCAGAYWLVRTPPPPSEATLPRAAPATASQSTLATAPPTVDADGRLTVHVAGAVAAPGVYELPPGARVHDAVAAAGGVDGDGDLGAVNLAAPAVDGSRIYVPVVGEEVVVAPGPAGTVATSGPVDVNIASVAELDALPGVGPATAAAIVTERERNGPFLTADDLARVPGIGPVKLASLRDLVTT